MPRARGPTAATEQARVARGSRQRCLLKAPRYRFQPENDSPKTIVWNPRLASGKTRTLRSRGDGTFDPAIQDANGPSSSADETILFADLDGDGCADRFGWAAAIGGGAARVARGGCDGTFDVVEVSSAGSSGPSTRWSLARVDGLAAVVTLGLAIATEATNQPVRTM